MTGRLGKSGWLRPMLVAFVAVVSATLVLAFTRSSDPPTTPATIGAGPAFAEVDMQQVMRGRQVVLEHACGACHGGSFTPDAEGWLTGLREGLPGLEFLIGPCAAEPGAEPCFHTRPRNLTPDNLTGLGRFTERQIFNALRFGLRPGETEDVEIHSTTPGEGNFPASPKFLAPPMPWPAWRHMSDEDLWAVAAYLKNGVKAVRNVVEDSEGPPDFWASLYGDFLPANPHPAPAFPTANEVAPGPGVDRTQVLRGRQVIIEHDCGACHGGGTNPANPGWLAGVGVDPNAVEFPAGPPTAPPLSGPCSVQAEGTPCWMMRPRNLTPDEETGTGGYTEQQIFNALRYGLRPSTMPDEVVSSMIPGQGNHPMQPDYLGIGMPWPSWRFMSDSDIRAVIAYLKHGLKPVTNEVEASEAPPDKWAGVYTVENIGPHPAPPFPTANETGG